MLALTLLAPAARAQISWQGQEDAFQVGGLDAIPMVGDRPGGIPGRHARF